MVLVGTKKKKNIKEDEKKERNIKNNSEFSHRLGKVIRNFLLLPLLLSQFLWFAPYVTDSNRISSHFKLYGGSGVYSSRAVIQIAW